MLACPRGHLVCSPCRVKMTTEGREDCPVCREPMGNNKSLLAKLVIEKMEHECTNTGCKEKLPYEEVTKHMEELCKFRQTLALALFNFSGEKKNQMSFTKEDLILVVKTSEKWFYAEKGEKRGWVPHNYVSILDDIKGKKIAKKDYHVDDNNSLSFSKGEQIKIFKEKMGRGNWKSK